MIVGTNLALGVSAAHSSRQNILLAGVSGLISGAIAMTAGEYVSVHSQADTEKADLSRERIELATSPVTPLKEVYDSEPVHTALSGNRLSRPILLSAGQLSQDLGPLKVADGAARNHMAHGEFGRRVGALNALIDMFQVEVLGAVGKARGSFSGADLCGFCVRQQHQNGLAGDEFYTCEL